MIYRTLIIPLEQIDADCNAFLLEKNQRNLLNLCHVCSIKLSNVRR